MATSLGFLIVHKTLSNEDTLLRKHCCRHKCLPVCPRAQHSTFVANTNFVSGTQKMLLILFRNILPSQQMFNSSSLTGQPPMATSLGFLIVHKALSNEDTSLRTHCCRHKCFPVCPRAQHFLRTQILCPGHKKCCWFCSETFCLRNKYFPVCAAQVTSWATMCPRLPVLIFSGARQLTA